MGISTEWIEGLNTALRDRRIRIKGLDGETHAEGIFKRVYDKGSQVVYELDSGTHIEDEDHWIEVLDDDGNVDHSWHVEIGKSRPSSDQESSS